MWASPDAAGGFAERAMGTEEALAVELARIAGETPWDLTPFSDLDRVQAPDSIGHRLVAAMISHALNELARANIARMLSGMTADEAEPGARADAVLAFELLESGVGRYGAG